MFAYCKRKRRTKDANGECIIVLHIQCHKDEDKSEPVLSLSLGKLIYPLINTRVPPLRCCDTNVRLHLGKIKSQVESESSEGIKNEVVRTHISRELQRASLFNLLHVRYSDAWIKGTLNFLPRSSLCAVGNEAGPRGSRFDYCLSLLPLAMATEGLIPGRRRCEQTD